MAGRPWRRKPRIDVEPNANRQAVVAADLGTLATGLYVTTDELLKSRPGMPAPISVIRSHTCPTSPGTRTGGGAWVRCSTCWTHHMDVQPCVVTADVPVVDAVAASASCNAS